MKHGYTCGVRRMHEYKMQKLPNLSAPCCVQWLLISASLSTGVREHPVQEASGERGQLSQASVCFPCAFHSLYLSSKAWHWVRMSDSWGWFDNPILKFINDQGHSDETTISFYIHQISKPNFLNLIVLKCWWEYGAVEKSGNTAGGSIN